MTIVATTQPTTVKEFRAVLKAEGIDQIDGKPLSKCRKVELEDEYLRIATGKAKIVPVEPAQLATRETRVIDEPKTEQTDDTAPAAVKPGGRQKCSGDGLRRPQIRVLEYLATQKQPKTRKAISEGAHCDNAGLTEVIGSPDDDKRLKNDDKHFPSLITLGLVDQDLTGSAPVYGITPAGKKAIR